MKTLLAIVIVISAIGAFFSGFVFWMANSSYQDAERLRLHGEYCDVVVARQTTSAPSGGKSGGSTFYYIDIKLVNRTNNSQPIRCGVSQSTYDELRAGKKLKAWVLGSDALLDYGTMNAGSVARTMFMTCIGCVLLLVTSLITLLVCYIRSTKTKTDEISLPKELPKIKRHYNSYSTIRTWKIVEQPNCYAVVPSPNAVFWGPVICFPFFVAFYWFINYNRHEIDATGLVLSYIIIIGTPLLMLAISLYMRTNIKKDMRPFLEFSKSEGILRLPQANLELSVSDQGYFIAHDVFTGSESGCSELNFIRTVNGEEQSISILHSSGPYGGFDKIGRKLETFGIPFKRRYEKD
ncbi:MAG: hypothetical protein WCV67_02335 [Victivallaceae bacterium]